MRVVVVVRPRDYPAPPWMLRVFRAGFALAALLAGVCAAIVLIAMVSVALGMK